MNPVKTERVVFTRGYNLGPIQGQKIGVTELQIFRQIKYLGVTLDRKLNRREP